MAPSNPFLDPRTWFYNSHTGQIQHITNPLERSYFDGLSWMAPFKTRAEAETYKKAHPPNHKHFWDPTDPTNPINDPTTGIGKVTAAPIKSITTGGFLGALSSANTWVRVAEVVTGVALIIVGLVRLIPPSVVRQAGSIGKVAAVL